MLLVLMEIQRSFTITLGQRNSVFSIFFSKDPQDLHELIDLKESRTEQQIFVAVDKK